MEEEEK
jgi:parvulin-like peptidyl-prolyl isomerase